MCRPGTSVRGPESRVGTDVSRSWEEPRRGRGESVFRGSFNLGSTLNTVWTRIVKEIATLSTLLVSETLVLSVRRILKIFRKTSFCLCLFRSNVSDFIYGIESYTSITVFNSCKLYWNSWPVLFRSLRLVFHYFYTIESLFLQVYRQSSFKSLDFFLFVCLFFG